MQEPIATWSAVRGVWETSETGLFCGHSVPFLATWPVSGSMRSGSAFRRPAWAPATSGSVSSSSRGPLLKTPTSNLGDNGGSQHPDKRKAGGHGPTLKDEVEHLLPTPTVGDHGTPGHRAGPGYGPPLSQVVLPLLPTPTAEPYGSNQSPTPGAAVRPSLNTLASAGALTARPSPDGSA